MTPDVIFTVAVLLMVLIALASNKVPADITMMAALTLLLVLGVITPVEALKGFANPGLMTIGALYVVSAALRDTGAIYWVAHRLLGSPKTVLASQTRMMVPTSLLSAFLNNTTVVAMMIPAVQDWAQRLKLSPSKFLLPLSYAAILGGTCTLIGTSTNLVVDGMVQSHGMEGFGIFDLAWVGVPLLVIGSLYLIFIGRHLLPERKGLIEQLKNAREYNVEMRLQAGSPLAGKTIREAGLRSLAHGYLTEIQRGDRLLTAVGADTSLEALDVLVFIGAPECARELQRFNGLVPAHAGSDKLELLNHQRCLVEVVLSQEFPGVGKTVRDAAFRTRYQAAILSISRNGKRLSGKVGDIELRAGDTLLLETAQSFVSQYQYRRDFMLVSPLKDSSPPDFRKAPLAVIVLVGMLLAATVNLFSMLEASMVAAGVLLATRCVTANRARITVSVNMTVLIVIGASFAVGEAVEKSGTANLIVETLLLSGNVGPWMALLLVYIVTALFTELITNNAAAVLVFPVALEVARWLEVSPYPFIVAVMFAASASFMTPLGYQTNLMVMGPGGYRYLDYLKVGLPMSILVGLITITLVPQIWPFFP